MKKFVSAIIMIAGVFVGFSAAAGQLEGAICRDQVRQCEVRAQQWFDQWQIDLQSLYMQGKLSKDEAKRLRLVALQKYHEKINAECSNNCSLFDDED